MKTNQKVRGAARHLYRLCLVNGVLDNGRVRQVAQRLASSRHRGALAMLSELHRLVRLDTDRRRAVVESAAPLAQTLRETIQVDLARRYGGGIETSFTNNPSLIGGLRITVGSDLYDGTVRARLAALEARL